MWDRLIAVKDAKMQDRNNDYYVEKHLNKYNIIDSIGRRQLLLVAF